MTIRSLLRTAAFLIAGGAIIDPAVPIAATTPVPVAVRPTGGAREDRVREIRDRLTSTLKTAVNLDPVERPAAVVLVGERPDVESVSENVPISTVGPASESAPSVRIVSASEPEPVLPGWRATFDVVVEGTNVTGKKTDIVLEQNGIELGRVSHVWSQRQEQFKAAFTLPLTEPGVSILAVRAKPSEAEGTHADNALDVRAVAESRVLKIAVYDPRPSWTTAFVRRVLEMDPTFEVSTLVKASKGLDVRSGHPPAVVTASALEPFDLVAVGAPEELTASESDALASFARKRGGAVLLLPDRRPTGAVVGLTGASGFDEMLVEKAVELEVPVGARLRGSEFVLPRIAGVANVLASVREGAVSRPAIVAIPAGAGQIIFSGVLDSWRFRASNDDGYSGFWRQLVAAAAVSVPRRLEISVRPGTAPPGVPIIVRARVRATEIEQRAHERVVPPISASVIASNGSAIDIRLWPTAEVGVYEGHFEAGAPGRYDVRASLDGHASADTPLVISTRTRMAVPRDDDGLRLVARATGGVATAGSDLRPLETYLSGLPKARVPGSVHPMRSSWWMVAFASLLCAEWTLRRKRGDR